MHESTRRLLCRVAFLLGCVVPTLCTLGWIMYRQSAWSVAAVEDQLSETIGLKCHIAKYYNPKPSKWIFENVRLERAGADAVVFPVLKAELVKDTWQLSADEAEVEWASRNRLWETLQEGLLLNRNNGHAVHLSVAKLRFRDSTLPTFGQLDIKHQPGAQPALTGTMTVGDSLLSPPLVVNVDTSKPEHWRVQLTTTEKPIDTYPLRQLLPQFANLGPDANIVGQATLELNHAAPHIEMTGVQVRQIDLQLALASNYQHGAGGAELRLMNVLIRDNSLQEAFGALRSQNGQLSSALVARAVEHLQLQVAAPIGQLDLVGYHELAVGFRFDHGRMTLTGLCDGSGIPAGTIMSGLDRPIIYESPISILPATNLASVFYDNRWPTVPASQGSVDLARWLAVPMLAEQTDRQLR